MRSLKRQYEMEDKLDIEQQASNIQRVQCRSRKAASNIIKTINEEIERIVEQNSDLTEEEKERYKQRFREIYNGLFQQNITIDGQDWCSQNHEDTSEFEPCDTEKRAFYNSEVIPRLDKAILSTARKRKHTCSLCNAKAIDLSNLALSHLVELKMIKDEKLHNDDENHLLLDQSATDSIHSSSCCLVSLTKSLSSAVDKSARLKKAIQMDREMEGYTMYSITNENILSGSDIDTLKKRTLNESTLSKSEDHVCLGSSSRLKSQCVLKRT